MDVSSPYQFGSKARGRHTRVEVYEDEAIILDVEANLFEGPLLATVLPPTILDAAASNAAFNAYARLQCI
jgi:hypothetical protein